MIFRFSIPTSLIRDDPELMKLAKEPVVRVIYLFSTETSLLTSVSGMFSWGQIGVF